MSETWEKASLEIGDIICNASKRYHQLAPLHTSWMNFARKHHLQRQADDADALRTLLERHGLTIIPIQDVDSYQATIANQAEEISALEHRITTLLRP